MADRQLDPARLQGEALRRWYLRSPEDLEQERQARDAQRYTDFFGGIGGAAPDAGFSRNSTAPGNDIDSSVRRDPGSSSVDPSVTWLPVDPNRWRGERLDAGPMQPMSAESTMAKDAAIVDRGMAGPNDGGELIEIGNPHNRRLKREYIEKYGDWPRTDDGRDYDVAHRRATADGGTNTLDNIEPMHPDAHAAKHLNDGDSARWGRRAGIARAFGGTVARALGPLGILSDITACYQGAFG